MVPASMYHNSGPGVNPTKLFFFVNVEFLHFFATKLGCCTVRTFSYATNSQAYQRKSENRKNESLVGSTPDRKLFLWHIFVLDSNDRHFEKEKKKKYVAVFKRFYRLGKNPTFHIKTWTLWRNLPTKKNCFSLHFLLLKRLFFLVENKSLVLWNKHMNVDY